MMAAIPSHPSKRRPAMSTKKTTKTKAQTDKTKKAEATQGEVKKPEAAAATTAPAEAVIPEAAQPLEATPNDTEISGDVKKGAKTRTAKPKAAPGSAEARTGKLSALDAAVKVLGETGTAMTCKELIEAMAAKGYWTSPGGKTPHATLYAAILRDTVTKGPNARFQKTERGKFALNGAT
jgi:hypothetical protein